ncbi:MAG: alpha/beta fold hydrolase [Xenococcaceae cyanobacterium]
MSLNFEIKGQGLPILCLHGHPGSSQTMSVFTNHLQQKYQTIAPDLRGYGNSRARGNFEMGDHLDDLGTLLDRLKINKCLLLGWSLGGILALELALKNPQRFHGLILIASAAYPRSNHPPVAWQELLYTGIGGIINYLKPGWQWNIDTFGKNSLFRYLIYQQTPTAYQYLAKEGVAAYLKTSKAANQAITKAITRGYNRQEDLKNLDLPSLVLAGAEDKHITAISSRETAQKLQNCQWKCYDSTAHLFPWEIPTQVLADIDRWLEEKISNCPPKKNS